MTSIEKTAETVEAAIQAGLRELGVGASDVMVEVLEEPSRGIMGVGARPARVRLVLMGSRRETNTYSPMGMPEYNEPPASETPFRPEDYERYDPSQNQSRNQPRGPRPGGGGRGGQRDGGQRGDRPGQGNRPGQNRSGGREQPYTGPSERATQQGQNRGPYTGPSERAAQQNQAGQDQGVRRTRNDSGDRPPGWVDRRENRGGDNRGGQNQNRRDGGPRRDRGDRPRRDREESSYQYDYEPNDDEIAAPIGLEVTDEEADETARVGKELLVQLLEKMQLEGTVTIHRAEPTRESEELHWILNIGGVEMSRLIGRRGETLTAIQYLLRLMISRRLQTHANIIVDAGGYKANRANRLKQLAQRMAEQAITQNRTIVLEPMPPHERRIVHLALRQRPDVTTKSIGEGDNRKVTISRKTSTDETSDE